MDPLSESKQLDGVAMLLEPSHTQTRSFLEKMDKYFLESL